MKKFIAIVLSCLILLSATFFVSASDTIKPLTISGNDFIDANGNPVRFWGFNLVSLYPTHTQADAIAKNLSDLEVNVVRPHHVTRDATYNWNYINNGGGGVGALIKYENNTTRTKNTSAYERFDYFNKKLREKGIYIRMTLDGTRSYLKDDVNILTTTAPDKTAWQNAMLALNELQWDHARDLRRMLQTFDERIALLNEEFIETFLTHENQYTNIAYSRDPQILTLEIANETSSEYAFISGNRFVSTNHVYPKKSGESDAALAVRKAANEAALGYWHNLLDDKWRDYLTSLGVSYYNLYDNIASNDNTKQKRRSDFLKKLDEDYFNRIKTLVRDDLNCNIPITFSTFWRGETNLNMHAENGDYIEEHSYSNPMVAGSAADFFGISNSQTKIEGMPYFMGELNQYEATANQNIPARANLMLATAAYGSFNNWTGINFFSWNHGDEKINADGSPKNPYRSPDLSSGSKDREDMIGNIGRDQMMLDHMRTAGIMYKNGLVKKSNQPKIVYIDQPYFANGYSSLMAPKYKFFDGWQSIHAFSKAFTKNSSGVPLEQKNAPWLLISPPQPNGRLTSDTNEIIKDLSKKQLLVSAEKSEGFGGITYSGEAVNLNHLKIDGQNGSATVIMVSEKSLADSEHIIISSTATAHSAGANMSTITGSEYTLPITVKSLKKPSSLQNWQMKITRPETLSGTRDLYAEPNGDIILPTDIAWNECELILKNKFTYSFSGAEDGLSYNRQIVTGSLSFSENIGNAFKAVAVWYENNIVKQVEIKESGDDITFNPFIIPAETAVYTATVTDTVYNDTNLKKNTNYEYKIQAYKNDTPLGDPIIKQIKTNGDTAEDEPPKNLKADYIGASAVTISWDAYAIPNTTYNIYRDNVIIAENINELSYTDSTVTPLTDYTYSVTAFNSRPVFINITTLAEDKLLYQIYKNGVLGNGMNLFGGTMYGGTVYSQANVPVSYGTAEIPDGTKTLSIKAPGDNASIMVGPNINWQSTATGAVPTPLDFSGIRNTASLTASINLQMARNRWEIGLTSQKPNSNDIYHLRVSLSDYIETTGSQNVGFWLKWQSFSIPLSDLVTYGNCYNKTAYLPEANQDNFDWSNIIGVTIAVSNESGANAGMLHDIKIEGSGTTQAFVPPISEKSDTITWEPVAGADSYKITRRGGKNQIKIFIWEDFNDLKPLNEAITLN